MAGILHCIEVVKVAEELIEAMHRGQELVLVAKMVLAELAGGVAHALQGRSNSHGLRRQACRGARLTDSGHSGTDRKFTGDEVSATGCAACLGVIIGEQHALGSDL